MWIRIHYNLKYFPMYVIYRVFAFRELIFLFICASFLILQFFTSIVPFKAHLPDQLQNMRKNDLKKKSMSFINLDDFCPFIIKLTASAKFWLNSIFRGRIENYNPHYLTAYSKHGLDLPGGGHGVRRVGPGGMGDHAYRTPPKGDGAVSSSTPMSIPTSSG